MSAEKDAPEKGFNITPARVGFLLSLIAVGTFGYNIVANSVTQNMKIQSHSEYIAEDKQITKDTLKELVDMNKKIDRLTFLMEGSKPTNVGSLR